MEFPYYTVYFSYKCGDRNLFDQYDEELDVFMAVHGGTLYSSGFDLEEDSRDMLYDFNEQDLMSMLRNIRQQAVESEMTALNDIFKLIRITRISEYKNTIIHGHDAVREGLSGEEKKMLEML